MHDFIFLDTETTGTEDEDRLIQVGYRSAEEDVNELFEAELPIKIGAMATHHFTNKMVKGKPKFKGSPTYKRLKQLNKKGKILVAHNAPFDVRMLEKEGVTFDRVIDTLKVARFLDKNAKLEAYNLQYIRYFCELEIEAIAHDAWGDILVLEKVFERLYDSLAKKYKLEHPKEVEDMMIDISCNPSEIHKFNFGKHKGEWVKDVAKFDMGYLEWLHREKTKEPEGEEDWLYTLELYLS